MPGVTGDSDGVDRVRKLESLGMSTPLVELPAVPLAPVIRMSSMVRRCVASVPPLLMVITGVFATAD